MYKLQILHASDLEGGLEALDNAPNFAAVVDALEADASNQGFGSILLSAGDNFIPGPFFNAGGDSSLAATYEGFYNELFGLIDTSQLDAADDTNGDGFFDNDEIQAVIDGGSLTVTDIYTTDINGDGFVDFFEELDTFEGRVDVSIMNALGFDASAVGNHEFDAGTDALENIINYDSEEGNSLSGGRFGNDNYLNEIDWLGVQFPYLTANLDFSQDFDVGPLFTEQIWPASAFLSDFLSARVNPNDPSEVGVDSNDPKIAPATILEEGGEMIGVVGATTQLIASLSSTGNIDDVSSPGTNDMPALAAVLQPVIDQLLDQGIDKIIVVSHLQQLALETELAGLLNGVDVIIAGGSDTLLSDGDDQLRPGDVSQGDYPVEVTNADGDPALIVSTDGEYAYVGRLVVTFDEDGVVVTDALEESVNGAYATDEAGVLGVTGAADLEEAIAGSDKATDVQNLVDAVTDVVTTLDGDIAGESSVFLNGERSSVRTEETNLGNLTADANLKAAQEVDHEVLVSFKNGGGIRAAIGEIVDNGDGTSTRTTTAANPASGKEAGEISELDIDNTLRFDNGLVVVELTPEQLKIILEHGVAATEEGATPGQFPQVGGIHFSFDPDGTAQELGDDGEVLAAGTRVHDVALVDAYGVPQQMIIEDGAVATDAPESIKVVTLNFLAGGGDGYPFGSFSDVVDLGIGEQQALSDLLREEFPKDGDTPFGIEDTDPGQDGRIQNLDERSGTVDAPIASEKLEYEVFAEFVGAGGEGASEVVAHEDGKLFVTNGAEDQIDIFDLASKSLHASIPLDGLDGYDGVQSVAVKNGVIGVAIARAPEEMEVNGETQLISQPGFVALFDAETKVLLSTVDVGNLPDQLTFSEDGLTLLVAGEGEKNDDSDHDDNPLGTVAVIDVGDPANPSANILDFTKFDGMEEQARDAGIRIQEGVSFGQDVEPEYIAISPDGGYAFVSLQENNAIAKIDLANDKVVDVFSLGTVDFSSESQLDANDNSVIEIRNFENLVGFRMVDSIATFEVNGQTYVATANEGDSRDFDEDRVADLAEDGKLDPALVAKLKADGLIDDDEDSDIGLERLEVSTIDGDTDGDGDIDVLHTFSSRSFSIFDGDGNLVFDSGPEFEKIIAERAPARFNDDDGGPDENRSDAKGPEPEAISIGEIDGHVYAFIGLERDSGIMIYDVTNPAEANFVNYIEPKFTDLTPEGEVARQGPEIVAFISAADSVSGHAQIAVAYEISGTTVVYDLKPAPLELTIPEIQGAGHISEYVGEMVETKGIVTAVDFNGYYLQDPEGDGDYATSDAIFVFTGTGSTSPVEVGDKVKIEGLVEEVVPQPGGLSVTRISTAEAEVLSSGNALPEAVIIGEAGRNPPNSQVISEDELPVDLANDPGIFNPDEDGIDFFESLEGMRVTIDDPVAISRTSTFNETWMVADDGENATSPSNGLNDRGGLNINADEDGYGDVNPERIQVQYDAFFDLLPEGFTPPNLQVGDNLSDITGVVDYDFGNFEILVTEAFTVEEPSSNTREVTSLVGDDNELSVATYNVLNITSNPADGDAAQIAALAQQIVNNLNSPDILALQEIQDDSGVTNDGTLSAEQTLQAIVDAIVAAGGPAYEFESAVVDVNGETGGIPGGNIRNAFLYNPERVEAKEITTLEEAELAALGVSDPTTFDGTRDPLLGVFQFNGEEITLINNHLTSRFGSTPVFGAQQPFVQAGEAEREAEAKALNEVVDALLAGNPAANVVVLGDLNTFEFTDELTEDLPGVGSERVLTNLIDKLEGDEAYSFIFEGNSQLLDHIFVTDNLLNKAEIDIAHVNVDFLDFVSDHEPVVAKFRLDPQDQIIAGTDGPDDLTGGRGFDIILGLGGNDELTGLNGDDLISGGNGFDIIEGGNGDDEIIGGRGDDNINGGAGDDLVFGSKGNDYIEGRDGDDEILGGAGEDDIGGGAGDDMIGGGDKNDVISGGAGDDQLRGDGGDDEIIGGMGEDMIDGGAGNDYVLAGNDDDAVMGAAGDDEIIGGLGDDELNGGAGMDEIVGGKGQDDIIGGKHDDMLFGGADNDQISGGGGDDYAEGGSGDDDIQGGLGDDEIRGEAGEDDIEGGKGDDLLFGGDNDDEITGGLGADFIEGGRGNDLLTGGPDADHFAFSGMFGNDIITDLNPNEDQIEISGASADDITVSQGPDGIVLDVDAAGSNGSIALLGVDEFDLDKIYFS